MRSTRQVIENHLALRREHDLETDIDRNYADDLIVLSKDGVFHGKDGIRQTAQILRKNLPDAAYHYDLVQIADDYALLGWTATAANGAHTRHGADAFVVKNGLSRCRSSTSTSIGRTRATNEQRSRRRYARSVQFRDSQA